MLSTMRAKGTGCIRKVKGSRFWHIYYYCNGQQVRESSKSESKLAAERLLHRRFIEMGIASPPTTNPAKLKYEDIREVLLEHYRARENRSLRIVGDTETVSGLEHLDAFFAGRRVASITTSLLRVFIHERKSHPPGMGPVKNSTLNRNLALLRCMMNLALRQGQIQFLPPFPVLPEGRPRKQFLAPEDFRTLREELPERLRPVVTFLYLTGCRLGEAREFQCSDVDVEALEIRVEGLRPEDGGLRTIPLDGLEQFVEELKLKGALSNHAEESSAEGDESGGSNDGCESNVRLFCTTNLRKQWRRACTRRGLGWMEPLPGGREVYRGVLVQHLRRSAIRNMLEAGVSEQVAMTIAGYKRHEDTYQHNGANITELHDAVKSVLEKTGIGLKQA
jgi:integrase